MCACASVRVGVHTWYVYMCVYVYVPAGVCVHANVHVQMLRVHVHELVCARASVYARACSMYAGARMCTRACACARYTPSITQHIRSCFNTIYKHALYSTIILIYRTV